MNPEPFLASLEARNWSPQTVKAYRSDLSIFTDFLRDRGLRITQVTPVTLTSYIEHLRGVTNARTGEKGVGEATISRRLAAISTWFDFLRAENPRLRNPVEAMPRMRRRREHSGKALTEPDLKKLLDGITDARDRAMFCLFVASGLRLSELAALNRSSLSGRVEVRNGKKVRVAFGRVVGKGRKERTFYLDEATILIVADYLATRNDSCPALFLSERGDRISPRAIQERLDHWCKVLGLPHVNVHRLRHTFATRLANAHISSLVLKELMGHENFSTTQLYFRLNDKTMAREYFAAMAYLPHAAKEYANPSNESPE